MQPTMGSIMPKRLWSRCLLLLRQTLPWSNNAYHRSHGGHPSWWGITTCLKCPGNGGQEDQAGSGGGPVVLWWEHHKSHCYGWYRGLRGQKVLDSNAAIKISLEPKPWAESWMSLENLWVRKTLFVWVFPPIYFGFWFCVFMGPLCMWTCIYLCTFVFLMAFLFAIRIWEKTL